MGRMTFHAETARELIREGIRIYREDRFKKLDVKYQIAMEQNDTAAMAEIAAKKQELRDAPAAADIEDIVTAEDAIYYVPASFED